MTSFTQLLPPMNAAMRPRLLLMITQGLALGLNLAFLAVIGNALFLTEYGAAALPYSYITVAVAGGVLAYAFAALQNWVPLPRLTLAVLLGLFLFAAAAWVGLTIFAIQAISFALVVSFALLLQLGFVLLGGQAGRLFDVRQLRRYFPLIVTGFVAGFIIGALLVPLFVQWFGSTAEASFGLLLTSLFWLILILVTNRSYYHELSLGPERGRGTSPKTVTQLLRNRFVLFIFLYQMLAISINQLTEFMLMSQVAQRYTSSESTAQFFSRFTALVNGTDLLFTTLLATHLLSHFGLNRALLANPVAMALLLLAMGIVYIFLGAAAFLFFVLAVLIRVVMITLNDGFTRTATNISYQALPPPERVPVQTSAEGIGGPLALGLTGLFLLVFNRVPLFHTGHLLGLTLLLAILWGVVGWYMYQDYADTLRQSLRRRIFGDAEISLADSASMAVIERLLNRDRLSDVQLALDVLAQADRPAYERSLLRLLIHQQADMRLEAIKRLENRPIPAARSLVESRWQNDNSLMVKGGALRALCAYDGEQGLDWVAPLMEDPAIEIRLAAMVGLLRYGGIAGAMLAGERLMTLTHSPLVAERIMAAQVIEGVGQNNFYQPLLVLLADKRVDVRQAALFAAAHCTHPHLLPLVVENLRQPATRSAAAAALSVYGPTLLPFTRDALSGQQPLEQRQMIRLVRACGQVKGEESIALLKQYLHYPDREIRGQIILSLIRCGYQAVGGEVGEVMAAMRVEVAHAAYALAAWQDVGESEATAMLRRALNEEWQQARQHLFYLLACLYDSQAMLDAGERLARGNEAEWALALELLDVTLTPEQKGYLFPLARPQLAPEQRLPQLAGRVSVNHLRQEERLRQLILGGEEAAPRLWTQACAVYAAAQLNLASLVEPITTIHHLADSLLLETTTWALNRFGDNDS